MSGAVGTLVILGVRGGIDWAEFRLETKTGPVLGGIFSSRVGIWYVSLEELCGDMTLEMRLNRCPSRLEAFVKTCIKNYHDHLQVSVGTRGLLKLKETSISIDQQTQDKMGNWLRLRSESELVDDPEVLDDVVEETDKSDSGVISVGLAGFRDPTNFFFAWHMCKEQSVRHKRAVNDKWSRPLQTLIKMRYMSCSGLGRLPVSRPSSLWSTNAAPRWVFNNAAKRSCCAGWQCTSRDKIKGYGEAANAYFEMAWRASATSNLLVSVRPW